MWALTALCSVYCVVSTKQSKRLQIGLRPRDRNAIITSKWKGPYDSDRVSTGVAEQLHCSLHAKELKVTTTELERQIGDWLKDCWMAAGLDSYWKAGSAAVSAKGIRKQRSMKNVRNASVLQKQSDWRLINKHGSPSQQHGQYKHL